MAFLPIQFRGAPLLVIRAGHDYNFSLQTKSAQILLAVRYIQPLTGAVLIVGRLCVCYNLKMTSRCTGGPPPHLTSTSALWLKAGPLLAQLSESVGVRSCSLPTICTSYLGSGFLHEL